MPSSALVVLNFRTGATVYEVGSTGRIHPGSTVKPLVAMAFCTAKPVRCSGRLEIGSRRLFCSHPRTAEPIDLPTAIAWSCNEYFASNARQVRTALLCSSLRRFGLDVEWPRTSDQQALMGIGEWGLICNVVELARAYRRLAGSASPTIREGLKAAAEYGTARLARPRSLAICGKTGTSVNRTRTGSYALFAGWAPADKPTVVVAVVASGGHGGSDAAPVARTLFERFA